MPPPPLNVSLLSVFKKMLSFFFILPKTLISRCSISSLSLCFFSKIHTPLLLLTVRHFISFSFCFKDSPLFPSLSIVQNHSLFTSIIFKMSTSSPFPLRLLFKIMISFSSFSKICTSFLSSSCLPNHSVYVSPSSKIFTLSSPPVVLKIALYLPLPNYLLSFSSVYKIILHLSLLPPNSFLFSFHPQNHSLSSTFETFTLFSSPLSFHLQNHSLFLFLFKKRITFLSSFHSQNHLFSSFEILTLFYSSLFVLPLPLRK